MACFIFYFFFTLDTDYKTPQDDYGSRVKTERTIAKDPRQLIVISEVKVRLFVDSLWQWHAIRTPS